MWSFRDMAAANRWAGTKRRRYFRWFTILWM